jgi:TonB family protein
MVHRSVACLLLACGLFLQHSAYAQGTGRAALPSNTVPPKKIKNVEPVYPEAVQREGIQGVVVIEAVVGADGKVRDPKVIQSIPQLDAAALAAVRQWEYEPARVNGAPAAVVMTVRVAFALELPGAGPASSAAAAPPTQTTLTPLSASAQKDWDSTWQNASKFVADKKYTEAIALLEAFIRRNPNVIDAHYLLSSIYEDRSLTATTPAAKRRDLESVVTHVARTVALTKDPDMQFVLGWKLVRLYGPDDLNDRARAERSASELVKQHPTRGEAYMVYAQLVREQGDIARAADIMRLGRTQSDLPVPGLLLAMQYPVELVQQNRALSLEVTRARLDEALSALEVILAKRDNDQQERRLATMGKAMVLELQAERVVADREQRLALLLESERWGAAMTEFKNGQPPPVRRLSASQRAELEWEAIRRWNSRLATEGRVDEAVASHQAYLAARPGFYPVNQELASLYIDSATSSTDAKVRLAKLEQASTELQRVVDLAPAGNDRDLAFERLLRLYGPTELNRPAQEEAVARAMVKRVPTEPGPHYAVAIALLRAGNMTGADEAIRAARTAIKPTAASRASMTSAAIRAIRREEELSLPAQRRLFDEATALLAETERLNGTRENLAVIEARMSWLQLSAERFEQDQGRAAKQRAEAEQLSKRAIAIHEKQAPRR